MWQKLSWFLRSWYGLAPAAVGLLLALYYGPRKMLETWDWYINRFFDEPVLNILRDKALLPPSVRPHPLESLSVGDLAIKLNRSHVSIGKSIKRLRYKDRIEYYKGGFRIKE